MTNVKQQKPAVASQKEDAESFRGRGHTLVHATITVEHLKRYSPNWDKIVAECIKRMRIKTIFTSQPNIIDVTEKGLNPDRVIDNYILRFQFVTGTIPKNAPWETLVMFPSSDGKTAQIDMKEVYTESWENDEPKDGVAVRIETELPTQFDPNGKSFLKYLQRSMTMEGTPEEERAQLDPVASPEKTKWEFNLTANDHDGGIKLVCYITCSVKNARDLLRKSSDALEKFPVKGTDDPNNKLFKNVEVAPVLAEQLEGLSGYLYQEYGWDMNNDGARWIRPGILPGMKCKRDGKFYPCEIRPPHKNDDDNKVRICGINSDVWKVGDVIEKDDKRCKISEKKPGGCEVYFLDVHFLPGDKSDDRKRVWARESLIDQKVPRDNIKYGDASDLCEWLKDKTNGRYQSSFADWIKDYVPGGKCTGMSTENLPNWLTKKLKIIHAYEQGLRFRNLKQCELVVEWVTEIKCCCFPAVNHWLKVEAWRFRKCHVHRPIRSERPFPGSRLGKSQVTQDGLMSRAWSSVANIFS